MRHFSGKIKTRIFACSFVSVIAAVSNHIALLPGNFATFAIFHCTRRKSAISDHIALFSRRLRRTLCALESRSARYVTMERRAFAHTLL